MTKKIKVAVGMSGGVDSGVAALLLKQQGYEVIGFHCRFWSESSHIQDHPDLNTQTDIPKSKTIFGIGNAPNVAGENKCCSPESLEAARQTAYQLDIPFYTVNLERDFKKQVVDYFIGEYKRGRTPNPCVMCNKFIKFGRLLDYVKSLGCDYLATGHYARIEEQMHHRHSGNPEFSGASRIQSPPDSGQARMTYHLLKGIDESKDQSYFLWTLTQNQLKQILFPVGGLTKNEVRRIAAENHLPVARRPESFEICFIAGNNYREFLRHCIPRSIKPGPVANVEGEVIGEHEGLPLYTIGQRHGFEVRGHPSTPSRLAPLTRGRSGSPLRSEKSKGYIPPLYVVGIDVKRNTLIVGRGAESERKEFEVEGVNWIDTRGTKGLEDQGIECKVRIRHQGELLESKVKSLESKVKVILDEPARGITPGQSAVFYQGEEVLGGGIIKS